MDWSEISSIMKNVQARQLFIREFYDKIIYTMCDQNVI